MKKICFILTIIALLTNSVSYAQFTGHLPVGQELCQNGEWKLVFEDEFNGSSIDYSKWVTWNNDCYDDRNTLCELSRIAFEPNAGPKYPFVFLDENVIVNGGSCKLFLKKLATPYNWYGEEYNFSAGQINTPYFSNDRSGLFKRGRFIAKIRFSGTHLSHSTFWLYGAGKWRGYGLPESTHEIDIAEYYGNTPRRMTYSLHNQPGIFDTDETWETRGVNWSRDWHLYMVDWDINYVRYYIDDLNNPIKTIPRLKVQSSGLPYTACNIYTATDYYTDPGLFHVEESAHIILSIGLDNPKRGSARMYVDEAYTEIDYVQVYQRDNCTDNITITNSDIFPFENLDTKSITLGTQGNPNVWINIIPQWELGTYTAQSITMLPDFISYPVAHDPTPYNSSTDIVTPGFLYQAKLCQEGESEFNYSILELDNVNDDTTVNPCEGVDTAIVFALLDSASYYGDTAQYNAILADMDSLGCEFLDSTFSYFKNGNTGDNYYSKLGKNKSKYISVNSAHIRIYPNPNNGSFTIDMPQNGDYDVRVVNITGTTVYETRLKSKRKQQIQLENKLPQGSYTVHIIGKDVNYIEKLIITK